MTMRVDVGAPSLTGKDAKHLIAEAFASARYPLQVKFINHMPRNCSLPEVGLFLNHCAGADNTEAVVKVDNAAQLQRVASSIEQIAELNGYHLALSLEAVVPAALTKTRTASKASDDKAVTE